jgi:hypothetical protein
LNPPGLAYKGLPAYPVPPPCCLATGIIVRPLGGIVNTKARGFRRSKFERSKLGSPMDPAEIDAGIVAEIEKALRALGGSAVLVDRASAMMPRALYEEMERLGADPYLLAIVGSWGDTLDDAAVLDMLRDWNAGTFKIERLASTGDVDRIRAELAARKRRLS